MWDGSRTKKVNSRVIPSICEFEDVGLVTWRKKVALYPWIKHEPGDHPPAGRRLHRERRCGAPHNSLQRQAKYPVHLVVVVVVGVVVVVESGLL